MEIKETGVKLSHYAVAIYTSNLEVKIFKDLKKTIPVMSGCGCDKIYAELIRVELDDDGSKYYRRLGSTSYCFGVGKDFVKTELTHILSKSYGGELIEIPIDNMISIESGDQEFRLYSISKRLHRINFLHNILSDEIHSGCSLYPNELYFDFDSEILYTHPVTKEFISEMNEYLQEYSSRVGMFKSAVTVDLSNCDDSVFTELLDKGGIYEG